MNTEPTPPRAGKFRDAIADEALDAAFVECPECHRAIIIDRHGAADAVLASDELQAIRQALRGMAQDSPRASMSCPPSMVLADRYGLPPSVVAWVMEGDA